MKLVVEHIHGNSKASGKYRKQITIASSGWSDNKKFFAELYGFFITTYGHSVDIDTQDLLNLKQSWSYQLETKYYQHRFFISSREQELFFLLKYGDKLTSWPQ
jgi:hypothetical protein